MPAAEQLYSVLTAYCGYRISVMCRSRPAVQEGVQSGPNQALARLLVAPEFWARDALSMLRCALIAGGNQSGAVVL